MQGIKIRAVLLEADEVISVFCQKNSDTDRVNNCWASIKCIGDAIKYKQVADFCELSDTMSNA